MNFNIDFLITEKGKKLSNIKDDLNNLDNKVNSSSSNFSNKMSNNSKSVGNLATSITSLQNKLIGAFAGVQVFSFFKDAVKNGLEYNKTIENSVNAITSLIVATSSSESSTKRMLTLEEQYTLARKEALVVMKDIEEVNKATPATLNDTLRVYKSMLPSLRAVGASQKELIDLTKLFTIAGVNNGLTIDELTSGLDGLASGTVDAGSELGKFMKALGLTNEELKNMAKNGTLIDGIKNKLAAFNKSMGSADEVLSNFQNSWDNLTAVITKDLFASLKVNILNLTNLINNSAIPAVDNFFKSFRSLDQIKADSLNFKSVFDIEKEVQKAQADLASLQKGEDTFGFLVNNEDGIAKKQKEIALLKEQQKVLLQTKKENVGKVEEQLVAKVEVKKIDSKELADNKNILINYYKEIGQTKKAFELSLNDEIEAIKKSGALSDEQINAYKIAKEKAFYASQEKLVTKNKDTNKDYYTKDLIEFYNASNKEKEAFLLNLEDEIKLLKERGNLSTEQINTIKVTKITEFDTNAEAEKQKIIDKQKQNSADLAKNEQENYRTKLQNDVEYYNTVKDFESAKAAEIKLYHDQNVEMGFTDQQMLEMENAKVKELTEIYAQLTEQELESQKTVKAGFEIYMNDLNDRLTDYKSLSLSVFSDIESSLNSSFSSFFDYASDSFLSLEDLAKDSLKGILSAIQDVITEMLVMQAIQMVTGSATGTGGAGGGLGSLFAGMFANGGAFENGNQVQKFATGGVVSTPTFFGTNSGPGVMGEAGPEAIMPLKKLSNGKLGVQTDSSGASASAVNVIINNNSSAMLTQTTDTNGNLNIDLIDKQLSDRINNGKSEVGKILTNKYNLNKR